MERTAVLVLCVALSGTAFATSPVPKDVEAFARNADACEHFGGEFDSGMSEKRQREIEKSVVKYCRLAQKQLQQLTAKYKHDPATMRIIQSHANDSVTSFR